MDGILLGCSSGQKTPSASRTWHGAWIAAQAQCLLPTRLPGSHSGTLGACTRLTSPDSCPWPVEQLCFFHWKAPKEASGMLEHSSKPPLGTTGSPEAQKAAWDPQSPAPRHGRATLDVALHRATSLTQSRHKPMWQLPLSNIQLQKSPALATASRATSYTARRVRGGMLAWLRVHKGQFGSASRAAVMALTQQSCFRSSFSIFTRLCP